MDNANLMHKNITTRIYNKSMTRAEQNLESQGSSSPSSRVH